MTESLFSEKPKKHTWMSRLGDVIDVEPTEIKEIEVPVSKVSAVREQGVEEKIEELKPQNSSPRQTTTLSEPVENFLPSAKSAVLEQEGPGMGKRIVWLVLLALSVFFALSAYRQVRLAKQQQQLIQQRTHAIENSNK